MGELPTQDAEQLSAGGWDEHDVGVRSGVADVQHDVTGAEPLGQGFAGGPLECDGGDHNDRPALRGLADQGFALGVLLAPADREGGLVGRGGRPRLEAFGPARSVLLLVRSHGTQDA